MMKARNGFLLLLLVFCLPLLLIGQSTNNAPASKPAAASIATPAVSPPANPTTPEEFFARARQWSDLEVAGVPFHLKVTFVATGDAEYTGNGTFEEWWQSKNVWRKEATLGDYKFVAVQNGAKTSASATQAYTPLRVRQVEGLQIFDIAPPKEKKHEKWKISQKTLAGVIFRILVRRGPCEPNNRIIQCFTGYSFTNDGILMGYRQDDLYEKYGDYRAFGNLLFPRAMILTLRGKSLLDLRVSILEKLPKAKGNLFDSDSRPSLGAEPSLFLNIVPSKSVTPPKLIHWRNPKYPDSERNMHANGAVVIRTSVDAKGSVREPFVENSDGSAFDDAAMRSVRSYRFKPATKDKHPVLTEITVVVTFHYY